MGDGLNSIARPQSPRTGRQHQSDQGVNENLFHDPLLEKGFPERAYSGTGGNRFCDEGHVLAESMRFTASVAARQLCNIDSDPTRHVSMASEADRITVASSSRIKFGHSHALI